MDSSGDVILRHRVDNNEAGFHTIIASFAQEDIDLKDIYVAIESPHEPVVDFLLSSGICVYPVNPLAIDEYRKSRKVSGSKSDAADAQLIANYLREHHKSLRVWQVASPILRQLQILVNDREKLIKEKVRLQNQLRSTLLRYFPQVLSAFSDITCPTALSFLEQFPTFCATQSQTEADWLEFLSAHHVFNPKSHDRFLLAMRQTSFPIDVAVVEAKSRLTSAIVAQLKPLVAALAEYETQIEKRLKRFADGKCFLSLPGVSVILAAKLLVAIGTDRSRFSNVNEMQSFFGTAPYTICRFKCTYFYGISQGFQGLFSDS